MKKIIKALGRLISIKKVNVERTGTGYVLHVQFKLFGFLVDETTHSVKELSTTNEVI